MSKLIGVVLIALSSTVIAFGQTANPPTGIQNTGSLALLRTESKVSVGTGGPVESTQDLFIGGFEKSDYTNYVPPSTPPFTQDGPCFLTSFSGTTTTLPTIVITPLDAGPVINVTGPNGSQQAMKLPNTTGMGPIAYSATLGGGIPLPPLPFPIPGLSGPKPLWLDPGDYTIDNGGGGADVGSFTATITLPAALVWTNADSDLTVSLASGVDIQWTGGDPNAMVNIQGAVTTSTSPPAGSAFTCIVPNTGEFMVTPDILSQMPATPAGSLPALSTLSVGTGGQANFTASGIDTGIISYTSGSSRQVVYQ